MQRLATLALVLGACTGATMPSTDAAHTCTVDVSGGGSTSQLQVSLDGPNQQPTSTIWTREGAIVSTWSYTYDATGRLIAQAQDSGGGALNAPDGIEDSERDITNAPTSAVESWRGLPDGQAAETVTYTLDTNDHVTRADRADGHTTFQLSGNRVDRIDQTGVDADTRQPYTRVTEYTYGADGRPTSVTVTQDGGTPSTHGWTYQASPGQLIVQRTGAVVPTKYTYAYDAQGRTTQAVEDDGSSVWTVDVTYAANGAVTTRATRDGHGGWVYAFSPACGYSVAMPPALVAGGRPGPEWMYETPGIPNAFE